VKGANGSKNRPHDAYPVWCRVPALYEPCSERVCVCRLEKCRRLKKMRHLIVSSRHFHGAGARMGPVISFPCRGTLLMRNSDPLGPCGRTMPRALWRPYSRTMLRAPWRARMGPVRERRERDNRLRALGDTRARNLLSRSCLSISLAGRAGRSNNFRGAD